jgi:enolase
MAVGRSGGRVRVHGSPWQGVADAAQSAAKQFADPVAMEGMNAAATAHHALQAIGDALNKVGQTATDNIAIDPRVAEYMQQLGQYVLKAVQPTQEAGAAIWRAHEDKINRIVEGDRKEENWDISKHRGAHTGRRAVGRRRAI